MTVPPTLKVTNNTGTDVTISDVGILIPASGFDTFSSQPFIEALALSSDFRAKIDDATFTVSDGTSDLSASAAKAYIAGLWAGACLPGSSLNQVILLSPGGLKYAVQVTDLGVLTTTLVT